MLRTEFEQLTGIYPTANLYAAIEKDYAAFDGSKCEYCNTYKANRDGLAESIQRAADMDTISSSINREREIADRIEALEKENVRLKQALEREQEWSPYESEHNVKQVDYKELVKGVANGGAHYMTDAEAVEWIRSLFDFDPSKITILHEIDEEEINRHRQCRKTGTKVDRRPVYCATDYHYIRFNTRHWCYEVWNDRLLPFYC